MLIKFIRFLIVLTLILIPVYAERRMAIDVGSGGTKVLIAEIDEVTNQITEIILDQSYAVPYQASLDASSDGTFDPQTCALALQTFRDIHALSVQFDVEKRVAVATSAFRKSNNSRALVARIAAQTGIQIRIIPQREEGEIAFYSAVVSGEFDPNEVVVWDIGTGSLQMTTLNPQKELSVYMGEAMGAVEFKSYIMGVIQEKDLREFDSPNPMTEEELSLADRYARAFGRKAYPIIKEKIGSGKVVGIGRLFYHSLRPIAAQNGVITRDGLRKFIYEALHKTDAELDNAFAHLDVSNCILTLAIMKSLHIHEIFPVETTSTRGILISPLWN